MLLIFFLFLLKKITRLKLVKRFHDELDAVELAMSTLDLVEFLTHNLARLEKLFLDLLLDIVP